MNRENKKLPHIKETFEAFDAVEIRPGTIWLLPVYFFLEFPPHIINYGESESLYISTEIKVERTNSYWCNNKKYFNPHRNTPKRLWVALEAKVRPFLVIQKTTVIKTAQKYSFINWQGNSIAGLPITSLYHLDNEDVKIDPRILEKENIYPFHYFIENDNNTNLKDKSYVAITTLTRIHKKYFTHFLGSLSDKKTQEIAEKFKYYI